MFSEEKFVAGSLPELQRPVSSPPTSNNVQSSIEVSGSLTVAVRPRGFILLSGISNDCQVALNNIRSPSYRRWSILAAQCLFLHVFFFAAAFDHQLIKPCTAKLTRPGYFKFRRSPGQLVHV